LGLIIIMGALSMFSVYPSPLQGIENQQVTQNEYESMEWFFENWNTTITPYQQGVSIYRFYDLIHGLNDREPNSPFTRNDALARVPPHYRYNFPNHKWAYFIVDYQGEIRYKYLLPSNKNLWPWTQMITLGWFLVI